MLNFLPFKNHIGLDISDYKIRFFQLHPSRRRAYRVHSFGEINTQPNTIQGGIIRDEEAITSLIGELIKKPHYGKLDTTFTNASLPERQIFIKTVLIPTVPANELKGAVTWAIEQNIPIQLETANFDWQVLGPASEEQEEKLRVLVSVAPKNLVDSYARVISAAGLELINLENESIAIARCLIDQKSSSQKPLLVIDVGKSRTNLMISSSSKIEFTFTVDVSGQEMTDAIANGIKVNIDDAEKAKIIFGLDQRKAHGKVRQIIKPIIDRLVFQIKDCIEYYNTYSGTDSGINTLLLTGSVSRMLGLPEYLREATGRTVIIGDPWCNVSKARDKNVSANIDYLSYTTAIGLSLKKFY
ncbi:MAG: type IV pilus assembly protein PilM [Patescibacteria group bacterium]